MYTPCLTTCAYLYACMYPSLLLPNHQSELYANPLFYCMDLKGSLARTTARCYTFTLHQVCIERTPASARLSASGWATFTTSLNF